MEFKRYDGFYGSAPQKKIDKGIPKCPFCGGNPHWLLYIEKSGATCMCQVCQAMVKMGCKGLVDYSDVVDIVNVGVVNALNLPLGQSFTMVAMQNIANNISAPIQPSVQQYAAQGTPQGAPQAPVAQVAHVQPTQNEFPDAVYYFDGGVGDYLFVFEDRILIRHKGALNLLAMGVKGDKQVYYTDITAIQFKKAGFLAGHIQLAMLGSVESKGGAFDAAGDENTITFTNAGNNNMYAEEIVGYMNSRIREFKTRPQGVQVVNGPSAADEILKFKQLLDAGIITQEEFDLKKKQLLGI